MSAALIVALVSLATPRTAAAQIPFNYSLAANPDTVVVAPLGASASTTITATLLAGSTQAVSLSASGMPSGVTATFLQPSCSPTCTTTLTLTATATTVTGSSMITVTGTPLGRTATFILTVATRVARPCQADEIINHGDLIACAISPPGDSDTFRFTGSANDRMIMLAVRTGGQVTPCLELHGPDGGLVASACDAAAVNRIDVVLNGPGTYSIVVRDRTNFGTGAYHLTLARVSPLTRFGTAVKYGQTLAGQTIDLAGDLKFLVFHGATNSQISLEATRTAGGVVPCIELYGSTGLVGRACNDSSSNRIEATLTQDGTHTLLVQDRLNVTAGTYTVTLLCTSGTCTDAIPTALAAAVSPPALSAPIGTAVFAFATITNTGTAADGTRAAAGPVDALSCSIVQLTSAPARFSYQADDPATKQPIGSPNTPVNILPGANQSFQISLTPTDPLCPTDIKFGFSCSNAGSADILTGVNTLTLTAGAPASCGLRTSATLSQPTFAVGQTLIAGGSATNSGLAGTAADFYVGILRPDNTIQFLTSTGIVVGNVANLNSFRPLAVNVPLATPFSVSDPTVFAHQRTAGDPPGSYVFFVGAVKAGPLVGGTLASDQILSLSTAPYSFP